MEKIRKAKSSDKIAISGLTERHSDTLPRSPEEISGMVENYFVAVSRGGEIIGCCGAKLWDNDAEIISLIIEKPFRRKGLGKEILSRLIKHLRSKKEIKRIFALTTKEVAQRIFVPAGFLPVGIQMFSEKVVGECRRCQKNYLDKDNKYLCNEIALLHMAQ